jgi:hypothetical protein
MVRCSCEVNESGVSVHVRQTATLYKIGRDRGFDKGREVLITHYLTVAPLIMTVESAIEKKLGFTADFRRK